ncbi:MAG: polymer-forming cytoskeletal protein [Defluviitaleaceae bacterium]|nr:polymer-forming cytoskeletal protein [Defluviitaleaceae bacterium]
MFGKKAAPPAAPVELPNTIIGNGTTLEAALLTGKESIRIDGTFYGNVDLEGNLILGDTGVIEGNVHAKYIIAAGQIKGNVECDTVLHVASTALINGDIRARSIIVDDGGQLNGSYQVGEVKTLSSSDEEVPPLLPDPTPELKIEAAPKPETKPETDYLNRPYFDKSYTNKSYLERSFEIVDRRDQN